MVEEWKHGGLAAVAAFGWKRVVVVMVAVLGPLLGLPTTARKNARLRDDALSSQGERCLLGDVQLDIGLEDAPYSPVSFDGRLAEAPMEDYRYLPLLGKRRALRRSVSKTGSVL